MQMYQILEDFFNVSGKFIYTHDLVLEIIVNVIIFVIALVGLFKVAFVGQIVLPGFESSNFSNYTSKYAYGLNTTAYNITYINGTNITYVGVTYGDMLAFSEAFTFALLIFAICIIILFFIYSIPAVKRVFFQEKIHFSKHLFETDNGEFKDMVIDHLWKPFWDNIMKDDMIMNKKLEITQHSIDHFFYNKLIDADKEKLISWQLTPAKRLEEIKKKIGNLENDSSSKEVDETHYSNIRILFIIILHYLFIEQNNCDILMFKWIQKYLEGVDIFWDGDVIGRRKAIYYFGRVNYNY